MTTLADYQHYVEDLERGDYPAGLKALGYDQAEAARLLADEMRRIAWQPWARPAAQELILRCRAFY